MFNCPVKIEAYLLAWADRKNMNGNLGYRSFFNRIFAGHVLNIGTVTCSHFSRLVSEDVSVTIQLYTRSNQPPLVTVIFLPPGFLSTPRAPSSSPPHGFIGPDRRQQLNCGRPTPPISAESALKKRSDLGPPANQVIRRPCRTVMNGRGRLAAKVARSRRSWLASQRRRWRRRRWRGGGGAVAAVVATCRPAATAEISPRNRSNGDQTYKFGVGWPSDTRRGAPDAPRHRGPPPSSSSVSLLQQRTHTAPC